MTSLVDSLAAEIRRVDGSHTLGADALAEALMPWVEQFGSQVFTETYEAAYGDLLDRDPHRTKNPYAQGETP